MARVFALGDKMEIKEIALSELKPYDKNPRRNDNAVDAVAKSIEEFGFKVPIIIDKGNVIVAGHTRLKAAQKLGLEKIPCIVADDLTPEQIKAFRLADNKTAELADWDFEKLDEELKSLATELIAEFSFELPNQEEIIPVEEKAIKPTSNEKIFETITFVFDVEQKSVVEAALKIASLEVKDTFGNNNVKGNALYEVARQWEEQKKLA